jgi:hypothetical protein
LDDYVVDPFKNYSDKVVNKGLLQLQGRSGTKTKKLKSITGKNGNKVYPSDGERWNKALEALNQKMEGVVGNYE